MADGTRVLAGVAVRRTVATEGYAALLTGAEMNPLGTDLHAFFAFKSLGMANRFNGVEMLATAKHFAIYSRKAR
jgi:hypothetical protein